MIRLCCLLERDAPYSLYYYYYYYYLQVVHLTTPVSIEITKRQLTHLVWQIFANVSKRSAASVFRAEEKSERKVWTLWTQESKLNAVIVQPGI
jgi:hypothetical protein